MILERSSMHIFPLNSKEICSQMSTKALQKYLDSTYYKGQLISECLLGVIDFPKKQQKI